MARNSDDESNTRKRSEEANLAEKNGPPHRAAIGAKRSGRVRLEKGSERMRKRTGKRRSQRSAGRPPTRESKGPTTGDTAAPTDGETTPGASAGRRRRNRAGRTVLDRPNHNANVIAVARNRDGFVTMRRERFVVNGRTGLYVNEFE